MLLKLARPIRSKISPGLPQPSFPCVASFPRVISWPAPLCRKRRFLRSQSPPAKPPDPGSKKSRQFSARGPWASKRDQLLRFRAICPAQGSNTLQSIPARDNLRAQFELPEPNLRKVSSGQTCPQVFATHQPPRAHQSCGRPILASLLTLVSAETR